MEDSSWEAGPEPGMAPGGLGIFLPRFGLEWPPAASGPQKSTMNRIFGRFFPSFIKFHCNRTIFEVFFGSGGRGALWSLNKKWGFYICVSYHQISYSLARVYGKLCHHPHHQQIISMSYLLAHPDSGTASLIV